MVEPIPERHSIPSEITKYEDVIDSHDVIARLHYLDRDDLDDDEVYERDALQSLADDASRSPNWQYGEPLIRDSYFKDYAEELAEDIGAIQTDLANRWPYTCLDWEKAARELQHDYTSVDFDGVTYWIRS